jgi:hypothetical protein
LPSTLSSVSCNAATMSARDTKAVNKAIAPSRRSVSSRSHNSALVRA